MGKVRVDVKVFAVAVVLAGPIAAAAIAAAALAAAPGAAAPPRAGIVVPGKTFGGLVLGATPTQVRAAWGPRHGVCTKCARVTWYFNERAFEPRGVGVEFRNGRAAAYFTLWQPRGWRTSSGVRLGDFEPRVTERHGALPRTECGTYSALVLRRGSTDTVFYVRDGRVWGFALIRAALPPCR